MPYIESTTKRGWITNMLEPVITEHVDNEGDLNFAITKLCDLYLVGQAISYSSLNTIIGVLECAKQEFYARVAGPYEEKKMVENGDVYDPRNLTDVDTV